MRPFDPAEVYVVGSLLEGTAGADVIFHWTNPNVAVAGFGEGLNTGKIRPSDGAVIMQEGIPIRVFHEDDCVVRTDQRYPTDPYANDELLDRHCNDDGLSGFRLAPDGSIVFFCREGARSADGQILYDRPESANAYDGERFLTAVGVFDIATQELHPFVNLPMSDFTTRTISIRVQPSGFWVATASGTTRGQLWLVDYQGGVQAVGDYPASTAEGSRSAAQLGADGALFEIVYAGAGGNFIERRTLAGDIEVVYDERKNPLVKLQNSTFVSGP